MNYFVNDDCDSDLYQNCCPFESGTYNDQLMEGPCGASPRTGRCIAIEEKLRIGPFPLKAVNERGEKSYEVEVYEGAVRSFIRYLEEREDDIEWLLEHQDIVIELFDALIEMGESEDLLPALEVLEQDERFSEILDENAMRIMIQHSMAG